MKKHKHLTKAQKNLLKVDADVVKAKQKYDEFWSDPCWSEDPMKENSAHEQS
jgi:hypothetical protein